jgi:uncharacterized membrane protein YphA (DoxX/SURF4 family)
MRLPGSVLQGILARAALVFLRIYLGAVFLILAWTGIQGGPAPRLADPMLWAELVLGLALVLGLLTRFSAAVVLVLTINALVSKGADGWAPLSNDLALAAISIALLVGAAGRTLGVDAALARRWPRSPFW